MKTHASPKLIQRLVLSFFALSLASAQSASAANVVKADNADNLDLGTSWVGGLPPTSADIAVWDSTVTTANTVLLGQDTNWLGIAVQGPAGLVTVSAGSTLTLGASGVSLASATQDLTLGCGVVLGTGQTWTIPAGRNLNVSGVIAGTPVGGLTVSGAGTLHLSGANTYTNNTTLTGGILVSFDAMTALLGVQAISNTITFNGGAISNNWGAGNSVYINNSLIIPSGQTGVIHMGNRMRLASSGKAATITGAGTLTFFGNSTVTRDDIRGPCGAFTGTVNFENEPGFSGQCGIGSFI